MPHEGETIRDILYQLQNSKGHKSSDDDHPSLHEYWENLKSESDNTVGKDSTNVQCDNLDKKLDAIQRELVDLNNNWRACAEKSDSDSDSDSDDGDYIDITVADLSPECNEFLEVHGIGLPSDYVLTRVRIPK